MRNGIYYCKLLQILKNTVLKTNYYKLKRCILLLIFIGLISVSCGEDEEPTTFTAEGYIVGFDQCINPGEGLLIVTQQDSMLTYNFPEGIFNLPDEIFANRVVSYYFPQEYLFKYKIIFKYRFADEDEQISSNFICSAIINISGFTTYSRNEIIILQAERL